MEVNRQRAAVLADNVRKWGLGNVAVTVNEPAQIAVLEGWFDIVAVDAPCSGEGMFRKIPEARDEWSENNVKICRPAGGDSARSVEDVASRRIADIQYLHVQSTGKRRVAGGIAGRSG